MSKVPYVMSERSLTIFLNGRSYTVDNSHSQWDKIVWAVKHDQFETIPKLIDLGLAINEFGEGHVVVRNGVVYYDDKPVHNSLTKRILKMISDGFDVEPMVNFLRRLMSNPSGRAVKELYRFLECNDLPITEDGYFLAYKNVNHDYLDRHSRTFSNKVGDVCEMPRNEVMDDPNQTCSAGLHFCSLTYLNGFWGHDGHTMVVKIDPADVVSIPVDYSNSKGRCCKYEVIAEHMDGKVDTLSERSVYQETTYHNKRDSKGRFCK